MASQGRGEATIPGVLKKLCDTQCHGLIDRVEIVQRLDSLILEVFSRLNDSVTMAGSTDRPKQGN